MEWCLATLTPLAEMGVWMKNIAHAPSDACVMLRLPGKEL